MKAIDRVRLVLEMRAPRLLGVEFFLQFPQRGNDAIGGVDGVRASPHLADMGRHAAHLKLKPEHADIGAGEHLLLRFGDKGGIGAVSPQMGHQRAVAGRFLLDHRFDIDRRRRLQADAPERVEAGQVRSGPGLHVGAAAAIHPVAFDHRVERGVGPLVARPGRNHVDMGLEDERASPLFARTMDADDDRSLGMAVGEGRTARMGRNRLPVHREAFHGEAAVLHRPEDEILDGMLLPARRGEADEILRVANLFVEALIDGSENPVAQGRVEGHACSPSKLPKIGFAR